MDVDKMLHTSFVDGFVLVTLNTEHVRNKGTGIETDETKLLEKKAIKEEEERCIQEAVSTNLHLENLIDKLFIHMKETYDVQKFSVSKVKEAKMYQYTKLRYLVFDEDELFKWRDECKKGMPIDHNFKFCEGTLSDFKGSKGVLGELSLGDDSSDEQFSRRYDVIRYKAEPIPISWPADDDTNKVYMYARSIALADYKYYFLYRLTSVNLHLLAEMTDLEAFQPFKFQNNECQDCRRILTHLCKINEDFSEFWEFAEKEWNSGRNQLQTISEYKEMVEELGYGDLFKCKVDLWMSLERCEKKTLHLERIKLYFDIMPLAIFSLILFKLRIWFCYSFLEKFFQVIFPKTSLETSISLRYSIFILAFLVYWLYSSTQLLF